MAIKIGIGRLAVYRGGGSTSWSSYWTPPTGLPEAATAKDDIVFCLMAIEGSNFIDGINGWKFPINDMDFAVDEATWTGDNTIFPFKTASTISPPADATTKAKIIPYDVNNFWYASDGTPNAIPVQAFFQNIDFANKCFCTHVEHTVNADFEELTPSGVKYITLYKSARTITSAYTDFFGADCVLPTSNVMFVSKAGNDGTGDGTFANPYLTIDKALVSGTTGSTVWILSGIYNEASSGYDYLRTSRNSTSFSIKGCGNVSLTSANASYVWYGASYSQNFPSVERINFQGKDIWFNIRPGTISKCIFQDGATLVNGGVTTTIEKCVMIGGRTTSFFNTTSPDGFILTECFTLNSKLFVGGLSKIGSVYVTYCKGYANINITLFSCGALNAISWKYCYAKHDGAAACFDVANTTIKTIEHVTTFERNYCETNYAALQWDPSDIAGDTTSKLVAKYNRFIDNNDIVAGDHCFGIRFPSANTQNSSEIEYNYFYSPCTGLRHAVLLSPLGTNPIYFRHNRFFMDNTSGTCISFGEGGDGAMDGSEIIGNFFRGCLYNYPDAVSPSTHGILVNGGKNFIVKYNRFEYLPLGLVVKANAGETYTAGGVFYNSFFNNTAHFYYRRVQGLNTFGNTFHNNGIFCSRIGAIDEQGYACESPVFKNNIFTYNGNNTIFAIADSILEGGAGDVSFDDNIFHDNSEPIIRYFTTLTELSYADAVTAGFIVNGEQATPVFADSANGILSLQAGSPGRGDGSALDAAYDDGLDVTTDWNDDASDDDPDHYPVIVTKQQGASWDKGAYVH